MCVCVCVVCVFGIAFTKFGSARCSYKIDGANEERKKRYSFPCKRSTYIGALRRRMKRERIANDDSCPDFVFAQTRLRLRTSYHSHAQSDVSRFFNAYARIPAVTPDTPTRSARLFGIPSRGCLQIAHTRLIVRFYEQITADKRHGG